MTTLEPISFGLPGSSVKSGGPSSPARAPVFFQRRELDQILNVYGQMVAAGEWRDYAIGSSYEMACFAIHRHASEMPIYRIEKRPKLARKQGAWSVVSATGQILKRGHDLANVLKVFDKKRLRVVD